MSTTAPPQQPPAATAPGPAASASLSSQAPPHQVSEKVWQRAVLLLQLIQLLRHPGGHPPPLLGLLARAVEHA